MFDVVIIGAGAAGLTAAMYTTRKQLKTVIISIDVGGQTNMTNHIENYPGVEAMPGPKLMGLFEKQALHFGAELRMGKVTKIEKSDNFTLTLEDGNILKSRSVIITSGRIPRRLGILGEDKFFGRGVSTCATCDGPLFRNKIVAVVGGGNAAVEGALELADIADKVFLIHRRKEFRADEISVSKLKERKNIELVLGSVALELHGDKLLRSVVVENKNKEKRTILIDGFFLEIGSVVDTGMVQDLVEVNGAGEIMIDGSGATSCPGIFAAGDVTIVPFKQTVISAGEGAKAALECHRFLTGATEISGDW
jgi:NADH-dependent peroxiredoxin subunit F